MNKYTEFAVEKTCELLAIDSPSGFTAGAVRYVKEEFEALGFGGAQLSANSQHFPARAINNRPYIHAGRLYVKLQFIALFINLSFFIYVSFMGCSKPKTILITERSRKP